MSKFKEGDRVVVVARTQTAGDIKSGLYFPHYAHLRGVVLKVFGEEASVLIDRDALPSEIRMRHEETEVSERRRYLDRLSEEVRGRASERERNFRLNYAVLVSLNDLSTEETARDEASRTTGDRLDAAEEAFLAERSKRTGG
ncbi:MAG: hypothetical protein SFU56_00665 [Capsulimonadales bacterium]|nr:hypothetical protein [Capsulimonadales bacterium]